MTQASITITRKNNFGQTIATYLAQNASQYRSHIYVVQDGRRINAKSVMGMMAVPVTAGKTFLIQADGDDEDDAITGIRRILEAP